MDLIDKVRDIASRIPKQIKHIKTEEGTKNAFIMPFISLLGYDVFNPLEVVPEFTADIGSKEGEKVDYAIKKDDSIIILVECKSVETNLREGHAHQLYRYFSATEARFSILTNGVDYRFYSDIDEPNKMDLKPFFEFNMLHFEDYQIDELKKFTKSSFSLEDILTTASTLKYTSAVKKILEQELQSPSEDFVRFFIPKVYNRNITQNAIKQFTEVVKEARNQFINERINERLESALSSNKSKTIDDSNVKIDATINTPPEKENHKANEDEIDAYNIIKAILRELVDVKRIALRKHKIFCNILLDDTIRKPICRLRFNTPQKYLGTISNKEEEYIKIDSLDDIFKYAEQIKVTITEYEGSNS